MAEHNLEPTSAQSSNTLDDTAPTSYVERGDVGYHKALSNLQIQMIAIGGAIGVGLFLGVGARLHSAGPGLVFAFVFVGVLVYLMMRALGEMVVYRPTSGAFVSYAREFVSDRFAHLTGWIYVTLVALAGVVELSAIGVYVNYWFPHIPGWISALTALTIIAGSNVLTVKAFGMIEFGASAIKVSTIILFLAVGVIAIVGAAFGLWHTEASVTHLWANGGVFPHGIFAAVIVVQGVVFSFSAVEIVGISAGEAADPEKVMPKAIRSVVFRIGLFYVGSIIVLAMLLPTDRYSGNESPFVTALASLGVPGLGGVMNFVVLTAAVSGVNATLYAAVRLMHNLAANDRAPKITAHMSSRGIPVGALMFIGCFYLLGILLISFAGAAHAFEMVLGACAVFIIFGWVSIFISHLGFLRAAAKGRVVRPSFRMPGAPWTDWICIVALAVIFLSITFDFSKATWYYTLIAAIVLPAIHLISYEYYTRRSRRQTAARANH